MVSREHLAAARAIMPNRVSVTIYERGKRETWTLIGSVLAERRPAKRSQATGDSGGGSTSRYEYVFFAVELAEIGVTLEEGDIIRDIGSETPYNSIDSLSVELADQRIRATCVQSIDPEAPL